MKILHILDHSLPVYDGYSFRSHNILRAQSEAGLGVAVVTSPKHEASCSGPSPVEETIDGVRHYRSGLAPGPALPFVGEWRLMGALERRLLAVAEREKPNVLHAHSPVLNAVPALRVGRRLGLPVLYEIRAFWEDAAADQGTYAEGSLRYRVVRAIETRCCRRASALVAICDGIRGDLLARGIRSERVTVVPNAVRAEEFRPVPPDEELSTEWALAGKQLVGFLGSFYSWEGLDLLIDAADRLRGSLPNLRVVLVGGGETEGQLRKETEERRLGDTVIFAGRLPHARMPGVYSLLDVLAYPRRSMRLTDLVTPLKPLEAMAMEKAFVASDVGGHRELVRDGETGLLHRSGDAGDLAEKIERVLADGDLRRRLGQNGRRWVAQERSWSKNAARYAALYESVCPRERVGRAASSSVAGG